MLLDDVEMAEIFAKKTKKNERFLFINYLIILYPDFWIMDYQGISEISASVPRRVAF